MHSQRVPQPIQTCRKSLQLDAQTSINPPYSSSHFLLLLLLILLTLTPKSRKEFAKQNDVSHLQLRLPTTIETLVLALLRNGKSRENIVHQAAAQTYRLSRKLLLPETSIETYYPSAKDKRTTAMLPREAFEHVRIREA